MLYCNSVYSGSSGSLFLNKKSMSKEKNPVLCEGGIEKNPSFEITVCHYSASLVMSRLIFLSNPSVGITVCHYSASFVNPNGGPRDLFFYPTLTLIMDLIVSTLVVSEVKHVVASWCHCYVNTTDRRQSKTLILSTNVDQKLLETEFLIENTVFSDF